VDIFHGIESRIRDRDIGKIDFHIIIIIVIIIIINIINIIINNSIKGIQAVLGVRVLEE